MTQNQFIVTEAFMKQNMQQSVHDEGHIHRVLYAALRIAKTLSAANIDVVILSALLHDVGRETERLNPKVHHAAAGAQMAFDFLQRQGWPQTTAAHVRDCILTHSHRAGGKPQTLEAQILFDADKLDLSGAIGCARSLLFGAEIGEPWYRLDKNGLSLPSEKSEEPSLFREYNKKLSKLEDKFHTGKAKKVAKKRQKTMDAYFKAMMNEVNSLYEDGVKALQETLEA
jgi:uncharacterized protein